ncbi:MAG: metal-dependent hydrolase [Haloquadratum sp.]
MNKDGHVLNGALLAVGLGIILSLNPSSGPLIGGESGAISLAAAATVGTRAAEMIAELSVPVILGSLFPDVDTDFGRHRKTLHNLPVLFGFLAFPYVFGNLHYVWIGVATHYVLDMVGSKRGVALLYPFSSEEYDLPTGVSTSSDWANRVTVFVTVIELLVLLVVHNYLFALDTSLTEATNLFGTVFGA